MSMGGGSAGKPPKLQQISIPKAQDLALSTDITGYALSDADWAARFPGLATGRDYMIGDAASQTSGGISTQATDALKTAGLAPEAKSIVGKDEFTTARNLGQPILAKEQRDRNFAETLLTMNPQRTFGLSSQDVVRIALANTGNVNALNLAGFQTATAASSASTLQSAQNVGAISNLLSGFAKNYTQYGNVFGGRTTTPAIDPYMQNYIYGTPSFYGTQPGYDFQPGVSDNPAMLA